MLELGDTHFNVQSESSRKRGDVVRSRLRLTSDPKLIISLDPGQTGTYLSVEECGNPDFTLVHRLGQLLERKSYSSLSIHRKWNVGERRTFGLFRCEQALVSH